MTATILNTEKLFAGLEKATGELLQLVSAFSEETINTIPFKDSWTSAQLADHVTKSNKSIIQSLNITGQVIADKNPVERVAEIKEMFLDFSTKMKSPEFIAPSQSMYKKDKVVADLNASVQQLKKLATMVDTGQTLTHPAFGEITKYEILWFVVFHTQRHIHQLQNILKKLIT